MRDNDRGKLFERNAPTETLASAGKAHRNTITGERRADLAWSIGQAEYYRPCYSVFACGGPYATRIGAEPMIEHDLSKARQLVQESDYEGQPVVLLHVTDIPYLNAAAIVTRQRPESIGFKVVLKGMDWSTMLVERARKESPDKGGWNLFHTWWQAADVVNPAVNFGVSGAGPGRVVRLAGCPAA